MAECCSRSPGNRPGSSTRPCPIRSTPTGISAVIDARGALVESIGWREAGVIDSRMPARSVFPTPFAKFGNAIPLALAFILLIAGIALGARGRYRRKT